MDKQCKACGKVFSKPTNRTIESWEEAKFCCRECAKSTFFKKGDERIYSFPKGHEPWNKGIKGIHLSPATEFKKGNNCGDEHRLWKGEHAGLKPIHQWVKRHKGIATKCLHCGITSQETIIDWANIDHQYKRNLDDYIQLCRKCHRKYDKENNGYVMPSRWK